MSKRSKGSLNAELASLFDPTPKEIIPEEEDWEDPQVESEFDDGAGDEVEDDGRLVLRADISLTQGKYKGVPSSREKFGFSKKDDESSDLSDQEDDDDHSSSSEMDDEMNDPFQQAMHNMQQSVYEEADAITSIQSSSKPDSSIKLVNNVEKDQRKAEQTKNQQKIWDSLLKLRIKEQRSLTISNRMPQYDILEDFIEYNSDIGNVTKQISSSIQEILGSLLQLGYELRSQHSKFQETIPEDIQHLFDNEESTKKSRKRKREFFTCSDENPVDFYWKLLNEYSTSSDIFYKDTFDYWQRKTQLTSKISQTKFKAINQSIVSQVDGVMDEPDKLIKRTQFLTSTSSKVLGKSKEEIPENKDKYWDPEIFDDSAFYQQLLKSLIEQDTTVDPTEVTRSWLKTRDKNKKRKVYSSKLSKDRVLKFNVHEKLVDFVAPTERQPPDYANDLFKNLFK